MFWSRLVDPSDVCIAEGQLSLLFPMSDHYVEQPTIEGQHGHQDNSTRDVTNSGVVQELSTRVDELRLSCSGLQHHGGGLQQPCSQQDQEDPEVVPCQTARHGLASTDGESWTPQCFRKFNGPVEGRGLIFGIEKRAVVVSFQ